MNKDRRRQQDRKRRAEGETGKNIGAVGCVSCKSGGKQSGAKSKGAKTAVPVHSWTNNGAYNYKTNRYVMIIDPHGHWQLRTAQTCSCCDDTTPSEVC